MNNISNIIFTSREIDILACLLQKRKEKKIAEILNISPRTVETHVANIRMKLSGVTKEQVVDFLETSDKISYLKNIYSQLLVKNLFLNKLREIRESIPPMTYGCNIINQSMHTTQLSLIQKDLEKSRIIIHQDRNNNGVDLYIIDKDTTLDVKNSVKPIIVFLGESNLSDNNENYIHIGHNENYELNLLELIAKIINKPQIFQIIEDFIDKSQNINNGFFHLTNQTLKPELPKKPLYNKVRVIIFVLFSLVLSLFTVYMTIFNNLNNTDITINDDPIFYDEFYLDRAAVFQKMDEKLNAANKVNVVALIGIGGSGKTTMAKRYANNQKSSMVWKINAETPETVLIGIECLAYELCQNEDDKSAFYKIQKITDPLKKEYMLINFLKTKAQKFKNWIVIYDNVTNINEIQRYIPRNSKSWGEGKVIITTTNSNITNNNYFSNDHVIHVPQLSEFEMLKIFQSIVGLKHDNITEKKEILEFLKNIPPWPLDVVHAAHYIKNTNISYDHYLKYIKSEDKSFSEAQESFVSTISSYTKTRYNIIELSLKEIINSRKDYRDLLLLSSLLDATDIPKELLVEYKDEIITNDYINKVRSFSLINEDHKKNKYFSFHDSIQAIIFYHINNTVSPEYYNSIIATIESFAESRLLNNAPIEELQFLATHLESVLEHEHFFTKEATFGMLNILGCYYAAFNELEKAQSFLKHARRMLLKDDKLMSVNLAKNAIYLGHVYSKLNNFKDAEKLIQDGLEFFIKSHDKEHRKYEALALRYLGKHYLSMNNKIKARKLLNQALNIYQEIYGDEYTATVRLKNYIKRID